MPRLQIDGQPVEVPEGATLLDAARRLGIDIPTLCFREGCRPETSCLVCVVKVSGRPRLVPSCATRAEEGMHVESETGEVRAARRVALELLLGNHLGDCIAPCHSVCPAYLDIPGMIRLIAEGRMEQALTLVHEAIPLPATLGRICPAPCERACRRADVDSPVSIKLLKRHVGDWGLGEGAVGRHAVGCHPEERSDEGSGRPPSCLLSGPNPASQTACLTPGPAPSGKSVAIVGAGPAGLTAAYYLALQGHACVIFDAHELPGGMLQYAVPEIDLPRDVLQAEIGALLSHGIAFRGGIRVGADLPLEYLRNACDAVILAVGALGESDATALGVEYSGRGLAADRDTHQTALPAVFVAGSALSPSQQAVRAVGSGHSVAEAVGRFLRGEPPAGIERPFTVRMGRLSEEELVAFASEAPHHGRIAPSDPLTGFSNQEAQAEADRCLHCDCRGLEKCRLRDWAMAYGASTTRLAGDELRFEAERSHPGIIHEPGKCVSCGLCVQIAQSAGEELGLAFVGRGFDVRVAVPFGEPLHAGLQRVAEECARACPTGALVLTGRRQPAVPDDPGAEEKPW